MVRIQNDWAYLYFLVPSIVSFLLSAYVIAKNLWDYENMKKSFHQLTTTIAFFSAVQCISWFHARYEEETTMCRVQEYIFQFGTMNEAFTAVVICNVIYQTIRHGRAPTWKNKSTMIWFGVANLCFLVSCSFNTARIFCPFNRQHELAVSNLTKNSFVFVPLMGYFVFYLLPIAVCWAFTAFYSFQSSVYADLLAANSITTVARQLRLYPVMLAVCMFPLSTFFLIVVITGEEVHPLLYVGALLTSSSGAINAVAFLTIVSRPSAYRQRESVNNRRSSDRLARRAGFGKQGELTSSILMAGDEDEDEETRGDGRGRQVYVGGSSMSSLSSSSMAMTSGAEESRCSETTYSEIE
jgi:hypothetical protein